MVFSSNLFLFAFLPVCLLCYFLIWKRMRNLVLFVASLFFYLWGAGQNVLLLICSTAANYFFGVLIGSEKYKRRDWLLASGIFFNLSLLFYFKYFNFIHEQMALLLGLFHIQLGRAEPIPLPIGISFFTFMAISYLVEIYRNEQTPLRSVIDFGSYLSMFPHLVAGPIVRFSAISKEILKREVTVDYFFEGVWRFSLGLGMKVLLANPIGAVADKIFKLPFNELATPVAWFGAFCYTLQIYFDFAGYSSMAIGLALLFGFHFPENFDQPYRSRTVTEFWRRWHMTLATWFRDFLYIPMGGNRAGSLRTYANLFIVFFLCGLWHGASWTFVVWGLYHGILLVMERILNGRFNIAYSGIAGTMITFILVMIGWVFFRTESIAAAWQYILAMFALNTLRDASQAFTLPYFLQKDVLLCLFLGVVFALAPFERLKQFNLSPGCEAAVKGSVSLLIVAYSAIVLSVSGFNPFIYFRF